MEAKSRSVTHPGVEKVYILHTMTQNSFLRISFAISRKRSPRESHFAMLTSPSLSYASAVKGESKVVDELQVNVFFRRGKRVFEEKRSSVGTFKVARTLSDASIVQEHAIPLVSASMHKSPDDFRGEVVVRGREEVPMEVEVQLTDADAFWCSNCVALATRLSAVEKELSDTKLELSETKGKLQTIQQNACIRQTALDVERALKENILRGLPVSDQQKYKTRDGTWIARKLNLLPLDDLWEKASQTTKLDVLAFCGDDWTLDDFDGVMDDLYVLKEKFNSTAHPTVAPDGAPLNLDNRLQLIGEAPLTNKNRLVQLMSHVFTD